MIIGIDNLDFSHDGSPLISDFSLTVNPGEIICLVGPNGSGKSTLIDCILGFNKPVRGNITVNGKDISQYSNRQLATIMSFVPQHHRPAFPYTVKEVVAMGRTAYAGLFGIPDRNCDSICAEALEKTGTVSLAEREYNSLSGGELKLVLLARALAQKTPLMILDEPTSSLDFRNEMLFIQTVADLVKNDKLAVIMATHSLQHLFYFEGRGLPVRVVLMRKGKPAETGIPSEILTEEKLADAYGVRVSINEIAGYDGENVKSITIFGIEERDDIK